MTTLVIAFTYFYQLNIFRNEGELEIRSKVMAAQIGVQTMEHRAIKDIETIGNISINNISNAPLGPQHIKQRLLIDFMRFNPDYEELSLFDMEGNAIGIFVNSKDSICFKPNPALIRLSDKPWYKQGFQLNLNGVIVSPVYTQYPANGSINERSNYIDFLKILKNDTSEILFVLKMNLTNEIRQLEFNKSFNYDLYIANQNGNLIFSSDSIWHKLNSEDENEYNNLKLLYPEMFSKIVSDSIEFYSDDENNYQIRYYRQGLKEESLILREDRIVVVKVPKSNVKLLQIIDVRLFSFWAILFIVSALFVFYRLAKYQVENKAYKNDLERSQKDLRNNLQSQTNFFAVLSHDLKNSIGSAQAYSEYVEESIDSFERKEIKEHLKAIRKTLQGQFNMLIGILQWSKTELGISKMTFEPCVLNEILIELKSFFMLKLKSKQIDLIFNVAPSIIMDCDRNSMTSILRNVVDNAIKYSNENSEIIITAHETLELVEIVVEDFGVGIPQEHLPKLFEIDSKLGTKGTNNEDSTGFGLKLINALVSKTNGSLKVESEEGKGTRFILLFSKHQLKS